MDAPEELRQTVRDVVRAWLDGTTGGRYTNEVAEAVLAVPAIADALARDAKVAEIVGKWAHLRNEPWPLTAALGIADDVVALYPEAGK